MKEYVELNVRVNKDNNIYFCQSKAVNRTIALEKVSYDKMDLIKILLYTPQLGIQYTLSEIIRILEDSPIVGYDEEIKYIKEYIDITKENMKSFFNKEEHEFFTVAGLDCEFDTVRECIDFAKKVIGKYNTITIVKDIRLPEKDYNTYRGHMCIDMNNAIWFVNVETGNKNDESEISNSFDRLTEISDWLYKRFNDYIILIPNPFRNGDIVINKSTGEIGIVYNIPDNEEESLMLTREYIVKVRVLNTSKENPTLESSYFPLILADKYDLCSDEDIQIKLLAALNE